MDTFLGALASSGGYALILGAALTGVYWLAQQIITASTQRNQEREAENLRRFDEQLARERIDREALEGMTNRVITALDGNTRVIATVIEVTRETNRRLEAIDRHLPKER